MDNCSRALHTGLGAPARASTQALIDPSGAVTIGGMAFKFSECVRNLVYVAPGKCPEVAAVDLAERTSNADAMTTREVLSGVEPSTIYLEAAVERPSDPDGVFPPRNVNSYAELTPEQRWVYANWLENPDEEIDAEYALIFLRGLERRLMLDQDPGEAFHEVLSLRQHVNEPSFQSYSESTILAALLHEHHKHLAVEYSDSNPTFEMSNLALAVMQAYGDCMTWQGFLALARYYTREAFKPTFVDKYANVLGEHVERVLTSRFGEKGCPFESLVSGAEAPTKGQRVLLNDSLPSSVKFVHIQQLLDFPLFKERVQAILLEAQDAAVRNLGVVYVSGPSHRHASASLAKGKLESVFCPVCGALLDHAPASRKPCLHCGAVLYRNTDPNSGEHLLQDENQDRINTEQQRKFHSRRNAEATARHFWITPTQLEKRRIALRPQATYGEVLIPLLSEEAQGYARNQEWDLWRANQVLVAEMLMDDLKMSEALQIMSVVCYVYANQHLEHPSVAGGAAAVSSVPAPKADPLFFAAADLFRLDTIVGALSLSSEEARKRFLEATSPVMEQSTWFGPNEVWNALSMALRARSGGLAVDHRGNGKPIYLAERALELLRIGTGLQSAQFHQDQEEAIRYIVNGHGRLLVVEKTGWGKSFVYFIAAKLLREAGEGPVLLVSPLLALMRNQILAAERMGLRAERLNSDNTGEWERIEASLRKDNVDVLLVSPERLANQHFRTDVLANIAAKVSLVVVDEAHCISDWGHDFRPQYRLIKHIIELLPANLRLLATTATANERVMEDLKTVLGSDLDILRGDLSRPSLKLQTIRLPRPAERLAWLAEQLPRMHGSGIIYTLTKHHAVQVADWLTSRGLDVRAYSSDTGDERAALEQSLLDNQVKALVATTAIGMGFDKPDLGFVVHYQCPASVLAYYQQVGRAGRALDAAYGVLLSGEEEDRINRHFIECAFPSRSEVAKIFSVLVDSPKGLGSRELAARLNLPTAAIDRDLQMLSLELPAPVVNQDDRWQMTTSVLSEAFWERTKRVTELKRKEQREMQKYVDLKEGHMAFLIEALDGKACSDVREGDLPALATTSDPELVRQADAYLHRTSLTIMPRLQAPECGIQNIGSGERIPVGLLAQQGRALCMWRDAGWGESVYRGKYEKHYFSDELVAACRAMLRSWNPRPAPTWVTCIPSISHPELVPDFAQRLAESVGLPFHSVLTKTDGRPEQKLMANDVQQARNVDGSFTVSQRALPCGAVLLIDDMVDSGWTMTVATIVLRSHGSGDVWPLALAYTGHQR